MKIESGLPIASLPPISASDFSHSDRSAISVSPDAVSRASSVPAGQDGNRVDDQIRQGVERLNSAAQQASQNITFSVDPDTRKIVVKVVDQLNQDVLYQFPAEDALKLSASLEQLSGVFFDRKA